jgi:hypothetical protein
MLHKRREKKKGSSSSVEVDLWSKTKRFGNIYRKNPSTVVCHCHWKAEIISYKNYWQLWLCKPDF